MIPGQGGTRHGRILRLVAILAAVAQVSRVRCEDDGHYFGDGGAEPDDGRCLRLAPGHRLMHEFGAERAHVEVVIGGPGCPAAGTIAAELHGDVFFRHNFGAGHESSSSPSAAPAPISISVVMPMGLEVGAHEAIIILLDGGTSEELDSLAYTFFTSDWRPAMRWMFPPDGYTFGRNSQRFLRFKVQDEGGQERCQEGAMSCARWSPMEYHVNYTLNGVLQADNIRQIYMISMASLQDGTHTASVAISDANKQPTGLNMTVTFTIDDSFEYTDDGEAPEYKAPCPDQTCPDGDEESCQLSCGPHSAWDGSSCACDPDWTGPSCSHHILSETVYLPKVDPAVAGHRCSQARNLLSRMDEVRSALDRLQHSKSGCTPSTASVVRARGTNGHAGLASLVEQVAGALNGAFRNGTALVVRDFFDYFYHRGCPGKQLTHDDLGCYFEPLFSAECSQILSDEVRGGMSQETEIKEHLNDWRPHREHAVMGIFWWNAMLLDYIASPNRRLRGLITRAKADLGWTHPIIGMHVRRGDSCDLKASPGYGLPLAKCKRVSDFMPHIRNMSELYGVRSVFVTSDSESVYDELPEFANEGFRFIHVRDDRSFLHHDWLLEMRLRMSLVDRKQVAEATLVDLMLLSEADYLIGGLQSGYTRMALALSAARRGYVPPYVSMDYPWTPRFGLSGPLPPWKEWWLHD